VGGGRKIVKAQKRHFPPNFTMNKLPRVLGYTETFSDLGLLACLADRVHAMRTSDIQRGSIILLTQECNYIDE
jgi:hypothetical protein